MVERILILFLTFYFAFCEVPITGNENADTEKSRLVGVDTVHSAHNIIINKDTKISRHFIDNSKNTGKKGSKHTISKKDEDREPDWSYNSFPPEVESHVLKFKKNMTECLKDVQANDKRTVKRLSPKQESPVHGECLIACVLKRNGVIENGKINKANLLNLVSKFYAKDTKLMKKLEKNVDRCVELSSHKRDECALAAQLNECTNDLMASNKHKITVNY